MTSERRKSILILTATLIIGILLGLLVPGVFHKINERRRQAHERSHDKEDKRKWFVATINRIVQPDSAQAKQIKPITEWAAERVDSIERSANQQMSDVLDSVKIKLKPIITEEQWSRLEDFDSKAKSNWRRRGPGKN